MITEILAVLALAAVVLAIGVLVWFVLRMLRLGSVEIELAPREDARTSTPEDGEQDSRREP
ncbi:hypothetical protein [Nocardia crassostreae]|uniref:hypothetical protein n=1 Tax=Nocardia crassostreae TaxID=53428 RepID=UPI000834A1B3|nr:hypothetical protein [Nocardia crassostreae]